MIRATEFAEKAGLFVVSIIQLVLGQEGVTAQIPQSHALGDGNVLGVENLPHLGEGREGVYRIGNLSSKATVFVCINISAIIVVVGDVFFFIRCC